MLVEGNGSFSFRVTGSKLSDSFGPRLVHEFLDVPVNKLEGQFEHPTDSRGKIVGVNDCWAA